MDTEIELKFLVSENEVPLIPALITQFAKTVINKPAKNLINAYYDTPNRELRALDIGLRTRCCDNVCEQTIKLPGEVVGGLHQRPEYNLPINTNRPDLQAFDSAIWPHGMQIEAIAANLFPIFSTNFVRRTWLIETESGATIEVVLDKGEVSAQGKVEPIHELEIELVSGEKDELFALAEHLIKQIGLRLGLYSKAARGYRLADDMPLSPSSDIGFVKMKQSATFEQAFMATMNYGIEFVQKHEQCYFNKPSLKTLKRIIDGVNLLGHAFWLFDSIISSSESAYLRSELKWLLSELEWVENAIHLKTYSSKRHAYHKKITQFPELAQMINDLKEVQPSHTDMEDLFHCSRYNLLIVGLTRFLTEKSWRRNWDQKALNQAESSVYEVTASLFDRDWKDLKEIIPSHGAMTANDYLAVRFKLEKTLLNGNCLGLLYEKERRDQFRSPWVDIADGIYELATLDYLYQLCEHEATNSLTDIQVWLKQKAEFLVSVMEQSRQASHSEEPYWY